MVRIVEPSFELIDAKTNREYAKKIELCARNCYKSEGNITRSSCFKMVEKLNELGHTAMLEHDIMTVKFTMDVGAYKDLTRHRIAAYAIESTRWCNYANDKFGNELTFIKPVHIPEGTELYNIWLRHREQEEQAYFETINACENFNCSIDNINTSKVDIGRMELSHSLKADVIVTANFREWIHIFKTRCDSHAHPTLRTLMRRFLVYCIYTYPTFFKHLSYLVEPRLEELKKKYIKFKEELNSYNVELSDGDIDIDIPLEHWFLADTTRQERALNTAKLIKRHNIKGNHYIYYCDISDEVLFRIDTHNNPEIDLSEIDLSDITLMLINDISESPLKYLQLTI